MKKCLLILACLLTGAPALSNTPQQEASLSKAEQRKPPCQFQAPTRYSGMQGTMLLGVEKEGGSSVLTSIDQSRVQFEGTLIGSVHLQNGRLVFPSRETQHLVGAVFQGTASDGQPVEVALCSAEPVPGDSAMEWYRIQVWNNRSATWENPCVPTNRVPHPRAFAVQGVWDGSGARKDVEGRFTFACENGAIAKCITWGYKPWAQKDGQSLEPLHQACTRMARADYCGDGRSHTFPGNSIDIYDTLQVLTRSKQKVSGWDPDRASFEAAWGPEGAVCLARTRNGSTVDTIRQECPDVFETGERDLGNGDRCTVRRKEAQAPNALVYNRSHDLGAHGNTLGRTQDVTQLPMEASSQGPLAGNRATR